MAKSKRWSYKTGERGRNRVRVYEDAKTGMLLLEFYGVDAASGQQKKKRISLRHRDKERGKRDADQLAAKLAHNSERVIEEHLTLGSLFDIYLRERTPQKGEQKRQHDRQAAQMFIAMFGRGRKVLTLNRRDWDRFISERREGRVGLGGTAKGRSVGSRAIIYDLKFLLCVLNWATTAANSRGDALLTRNPLKGLPLPKQESPKQPLISRDEYMIVLPKAEEVDWRFRVAFVLSYETGHRIGAVRKLRWSDIDVHNGTIRWPESRDKSRFEHETPLSQAALAAIELARTRRAGIGDAWLLPSPSDPTKACSKERMYKWWRRAECLAGVAHVEGRAYHSFRRRFATDMKPVNVRDAAYLGGWKTTTMLLHYQAVEPERLKQAINDRERLSAVNGQ